MNKKIVILSIVVLLVIFVSLGVAATKVFHEINEQTQQPHGTVSSESSNTSNLISLDRAKEIALERAGLSANDVVFDRTELDRESGVYVYEIEFRQNRTEYEADISAADGKVLSWKVDNVD